MTVSLKTEKQTKRYTDDKGNRFEQTIETTRVIRRFTWKRPGFKRVAELRVNYGPIVPVKVKVA